MAFSKPCRRPLSARWERQSQKPRGKSFPLSAEEAAENLFRNRLPKKDNGDHPQIDSHKKKEQNKAHYFSLRILFLTFTRCHIFNIYHILNKMTI